MRGYFERMNVGGFGG